MNAVRDYSKVTMSDRNGVTIEAGQWVTTYGPKSGNVLRRHATVRQVTASGVIVTSLSGKTICVHPTLLAIEVP